MKKKQYRSVLFITALLSVLLHALLLQIHTPPEEFVPGSRPLLQVEMRQLARGANLDAAPHQSAGVAASSPTPKRSKPQPTLVSRPLTRAFPKKEKPDSSSTVSILPPAVTDLAVSAVDEEVSAVDLSQLLLSVPQIPYTQEQVKRALPDPEGQSLRLPEPPGYLYAPAPVYPREARRRGWQGQVVLRVWVDLRGQVEHLQVVRSSNYALLDRAAYAAVRFWRFRPQADSGAGSPRKFQVPVNFRLSTLSDTWP